jgi:TrmH family RNA methyltransferase
MKLIQSRDNPRYKELMRLASSSRECRQAGMTLLEGEHLVEMYRDSGGRAAMLVASDAGTQQRKLRELFESTPADERLVLGERLVAGISRLVSASDIIAVVPVPAVDAWPEHPGTCVLLEGLQDPGNLGSIFRTAAAAGVGRIALSAGSASAWAPKVVRAGMGAHFRLAIHEGADLPAIASRYAGTVIATSPHARASLFSADLSGPTAWVFGNEGAGLSARMSEATSQQYAIPMPGAVESLNVAATVAVCLFEQLRQRATPVAPGTRPHRASA